MASQTRALQEVALHVFHAVFVQKRPADRELAAYLRQRTALGSRDRRLLSETLYAVFRWWGWLRHVAPGDLLRVTDAAASEAGPPAGSWEKLLLGAWLMDALPFDSIAAYWAGNAHLDFARLAQGDRQAAPQDRFALFSRACSVQRNGVPHMDELLPAWAAAEAAALEPLEKLLLWLQRRPPLWLRIQKGTPADVLAELKQAGLDPAPDTVLESAVRVNTGAVNLYTLPAYRNGSVEVQDLASQAVGRICSPTAGERWWDPCAGGGGKSLLLASLMRGKGTVVAGDIREKKLESLRMRARRGGFSNIQARPWDGRKLAPNRATFDGVLADVPCTCSGTWRRNPAARWSSRQEDVAEMAAMQAGILRSAASGVKPGGALVYATCSMFRRENEDIVRAFLAETPQFRLEPFPHPLTGAASPGMVCILPWEGDCDAMFAARMRRGPA